MTYVFKHKSYPPLNLLLYISGCSAAGSALDWGSRGRKFKSCHSDHVGAKFALLRFSFAEKHPPASLLLLFRKKARLARLFTCKRTHYGSLSLPPFCDVAASPLGYLNCSAFPKQKSCRKMGFLFCIIHFSLFIIH